MKVAVLVSGGGHLDEALSVLDAFQGHSLFLVTYRQKSLASFHDPRIQKVYFLTLWGSRGWLLWLSLFVNVFQWILFFLRERPEVLFSTGSEIAITPSLLGKGLFRFKVIFLETVTRVDAPSRTAKMVYPAADLFLVQWEDLLKHFGSKAQCVGRVF